jgi:hypothetical protein
MASELRVDTLKDSSGNNSVGMAYVAGGSAKAWANINGSGTVVFRDSLNCTSLTDHSAGIFTTSFTNSMNNADYSTTATSSLNNAYSGDMIVMIHATGTVKTKTYYGSGYAGTDVAINCHSNFGDLA